MYYQKTMKMIAIILVVIAGAFAQIPANVVNKIREVGNKRINEVKQLNTKAEEIEKKMDNLLEKALELRRAKTQKEIDRSTLLADKMIKNYTDTESKKISGLVQKYERVSKQTIESGKRIKEMKEKDYNAHVKLLRYLQTQVVKETRALEQKRAQMERSRRKETIELNKAIRAIRVARMQGMKQAAEAARRRHQMLKKAAEEEQKRMKEEIEERKKLVESWKTKMAHLEATELEHMRTLDQVERDRKMRGLIAKTKEEQERLERRRRIMKEKAILYLSILIKQ